MKHIQHSTSHKSTTHLMAVFCLFSDTVLPDIWREPDGSCAGDGIPGHAASGDRLV